jgi:hypothetical protein
MFRKALLTTTAIVIVGSLSQYAAIGRPLTTGAERDRNKDFLCAYGHNRVSATNSYFDSNTTTWTHVAIPIIGRGQTVDSITVKDARSNYYSSGGFSAGIYGNTRGGPGRLISGGAGKAPNHCGSVKIAIRPITLKKGKRYWVEEAAVQPPMYSKNEMFWAIDPKRKQVAYSQFHRRRSSSSYSSSSTTPWSPQSTAPYVRLK